MVSLWIPRIALFLSVLFAARRGEEPERLVAAVLFATFALDIANHAWFGTPDWFTVDPGHLVIDSWAFVLLMWIALRANRGWPLLVGSGQLIVVIGHIAKVWELDMVRWAYWAMTQIPFLFQLCVLAFGTAAHIARRRRVGSYHNWRPA